MGPASGLRRVSLGQSNARERGRDGGFPHAVMQPTSLRGSEPVASGKIQVRRKRSSLCSHPHRGRGERANGEWKEMRKPARTAGFPFRERRRSCGSGDSNSQPPDDPPCSCPGPGLTEALATATRRLPRADNHEQPFPCPALEGGGAEAQEAGKRPFWPNQFRDP